jgi:hypothetical protein
MKTRLFVSSLIGILAIGLIGCASSTLSVHVDLFPHRTSNAPAGPDIDQLLSATDALSGHFKEFMTAYIKAEQQALETIQRAPAKPVTVDAPKDAEEVLTPRGKEAGMQTTSRNIERAQKFQTEYAQRIEAVRNTLLQAKAETLAASTIKNLEQRFQKEVQARSIAARAAISARLVVSELQRELFNDTAETHRLSLRPISQNPTLQQALKSLQNADPKLGHEAETSTASAEAESKTRQATLAASQYVLQEAATGSAVTFANPDLLADDGDPFYQEIIARGPAASWRTNFFHQEVRADGKADYLIVRETPVRFTVHEARSNPAQLIDAQLRLARAGLQTVASAAKAINPALGALSGGGKSKPVSTDAGTNSASAQIEIPQVSDEEIRHAVRKLVVRLQGARQELSIQKAKAGQQPADLNTWATHFFETDVSPILKSYSRNLEALVEQPKAETRDQP